ncbi:MAG: histidine kinase [Sphaerochaetaceae bacterium]|nr:histidine kinase [Sphaerochaetaceae bacterium]
MKIIDNAEITRYSRVAGARLLAVGLLVTALSLIAISLLLSKLLSPFGYMEQQLLKIKNGDLNTFLEIEGPREFVAFSRQFNSMIDTINNVVVKNYELELENKNNQLKALQAQLDPHFINNTLQAIGAQALKKGNEATYLLIIKFGKMMRYIMNFKDMTVSLKDELDYTLNYLEFQKLRFAEKLDYETHIEDSALSLEIPRLIIQPLVENAIKHGYSSDPNSYLKIELEAGIKGGLIIVKCNNSGQGLQPETIKKLQEDLILAKKNRNDSVNIGLRNTTRRLYLLYGDSANLEVESKNSQGFSVKLEIPYNKENS